MGLYFHTSMTLTIVYTSVVVGVALCKFVFVGILSEENMNASRTPHIVLWYLE